MVIYITLLMKDHLTLEEEQQVDVKLCTALSGDDFLVGISLIERESGKYAVICTPMLRTILQQE